MNVFWESRLTFREVSHRIMIICGWCFSLWIKKQKKTYWIEGMKNCSFSHKEYETAGYGSYKCSFSYPKSKRFKIMAYTVEFGKLMNGKFEPIVGRYEDAESYAEIISSSGSKWTSSEMDLRSLTFVN